MAYLSKDQVRQIIAKAPQGSSPEGVVAALRQEGHQLEGMASLDTQAGPAQVAPMSKPTTVKSVTAEGMPALGMMLGGSLGSLAGPMAGRAGAALGGMGGVAGQMALTGNTDNAVSRTLKAGAFGAGTQLAGDVVGKGMSKMGVSLMDRGIGETPGLARRFASGVSREDVARRALKEGVRVNQKGLDKVTGRRIESSAKEDDMLHALDDQGMRAHLTKLSEPWIKRIEKAERRKVTLQERLDIAREVRAAVYEAMMARTSGIVKRNPRPSRLKMSETQDVKQYAGQRADFMAEQGGKEVSADPNKWRDIQRGARGALPDQLHTQSGNTQQLMALEQALIDAVSRGDRMVQPAIPLPLGTQIPLPIRFSQDALSGWGHVWNNPFMQGIPTNLLRAGTVPFTQSPPDSTENY